MVDERSGERGEADQKASAADKFAEKIALMRHLTNLTGGVNDFQVHQLKFWFLGATGVKKFTIDIDSDAFKVLYRIKHAGALDSAKMDTLVRYIRGLLGDKWSFEVLLERSNGKDQVLCQR